MRLKKPASNPVEKIVARVQAAWSKNGGCLPDSVMNEIEEKPEWGVAFVVFLKDCGWTMEALRTQILFQLIAFGVRTISDNRERGAPDRVLLKKLQDILYRVLPVLPRGLMVELNQLVFDTRLPVDLLPIEKYSLTNLRENVQEEIDKDFSGLWDRFWCEDGFTFFDGLVAQMQLLPVAEQLPIILQVATSQNPIVQEAAVLMLLHPRVDVRKEVARRFVERVPPKCFTPKDLRRLRLIRNWVLQEERVAVEALIAHLENDGLTPAVYPKTKFIRAHQTLWRGNGLSFLVIETERENQRQLSSVFLTVGFGIGVPEVQYPASKQDANDAFALDEKSTLLAKFVGEAYVKKIVQHFLFETVEKGGIPEHRLLLLAESCGMQDWCAQKLSWANELNLLREAYRDSLTEESIQASLLRSTKWFQDGQEGAEIFESWVAQGEALENVLLSLRAESKDFDKSVFIEKATKRVINLAPDKWKWNLLMACLWMHEKETHPFSQDMVVMLHCLENRVPLAKIPIFYYVAAYSLAVSNCL